MIRRILLSVLVVALPASAFAGELERTLKGRWLGAWVVLTTDSYSDCLGAYTNNRINGNLVKSNGRVRFQAGELAKLDKVDVKRSRLDLLLTLQEPVLLPRQDGPFTLWDEVWCKVELEVEVPRQAVKGKDDDAIEQLVEEVLEGYATEDEATASGTWNRREREPFPDDYESTLARHSVWRAEQTNLAVQAKIDHAVEETSRMVDRLAENPVYLAGLAQGVQAARGVDLDRCPTVLAVDLGVIRRQAAQAKAKEKGLEALFIQGFEDGKVLVYGLEMLRDLPACFVPVPELPEGTEYAGYQPER